MLRRRVAELDATPPASPGPDDPRLRHFLSVMQLHTDTRIEAEVGGPAIVGAAQADEIIGTCRLLADIRRNHPALVDGPLRRDEQTWIGTSRQVPELAAHRFVAARDRKSEPPSTKPFGLGLYTSTAVSGGRSMWRAYLDNYHGSWLYPLPWYTWRLLATPDARVLEVTRARDWVAFLEAYPRVVERLVFPDWAAVAADLDGIHLTLPAVAAIQGFNLPSAHGLTAAAFWDLETTLWLRWCFSEPELSDVTR
ncbi:hypothetical protein [Micromonospora solifontis]|uniref:hypothetical protein n=1 Tax=Micromonospora solifontis TaxID=2487138 RepID=UPI001F383F6A|nr:hypothetical protein [Micromonospora solifontis]